MAHKTKAEWDESQQDLNVFLQVGDTVDKKMADYFCTVFPPAYCSGSLLQMGRSKGYADGRDEAWDAYDKADAVCKKVRAACEEHDAAWEKAWYDRAKAIGLGDQVKLEEAWDAW